MAIRSITRRTSVPAPADPVPHADQEHELEDHDRGLAFDLPRIVDRRRALGFLVGGVGAATLVACGSSSSDSSSTTAAADTSSSSSSDGSSSSTSSSTSSGSADGTTEVPDETGGPFPGDGSNGPNALTESGVVRRDITTSFGGSSGTAEGVATTVTMTLLDVAGGGTPLAGAAVYIWHCDRDGEYSMYGDAADQNYLRGVQETDAEGTVTFETIYPGAYAGRWPHIHFEVYADLDTATSAGSKLKTSQLALPEAISAEVYATSGYEQSVTNLARTSLDSDMVFSDGYASQLATASGSMANGLTMSLNVGV